MTRDEYLRILGIKNNFPGEREIKSAWRYKAMILHPDRLPRNASAEMKQRAKEEFNEALNAYNYLIDIYKTRSPSANTLDKQQDPRLMVEETNIEFLNIVIGRAATRELILRKLTGARICGTITSSTAWLKVVPPTFDFSSASSIITVHVNTRDFSANSGACVYDGYFDILTNSGTSRVNVVLMTVGATTKKYPADAKAHMKRGNTYRENKDYDKAIAAFNMAIKLDSKYIAAYHNRGLTYYEKGDFDKAIADYNTAIDLDQKDSEGYFYRGLAYYEKNEKDKAQADFNKAKQLGYKIVKNS